MISLKKSLFLVFVFFISIFNLVLYQNNENRDLLAKEQIAHYQQKMILEQKTIDALNDLDLLAQAVSIYDIDLNKKIYIKNDNTKMPLASLVKTMTVITALENNSNKQIIISKNTAKDTEGDFLKKDEVWDIFDLAKFTLVLSSNEGALALAESDTYFLNKMNQKALEIGMTNTVFFNVTGLDIDEKNAGSYGSANDANKLAIYAFENYPLVFNKTIFEKLQIESDSGFVHNIKNTNIILNKIPNVLFSKTGFTNLAGGNLSIIFENIDGHKIAVTILGSTMDGRFSDMEKIVNTLYNLEYDK